MFTGIITDIGTLTSIEGGTGKRLVIGTRYDVATIEMGASIACNGICLTVVEKEKGWFAVDASSTTLAATTMQHWQAGERINLERALKMGDELGGHFVTGHVDGVAEIIEIQEEQGCRHYVIACPAELMRFIAPKGSVTLDGVSLTVNWTKAGHFGLTLIPHTLEVTNWQEKREHNRLNLEVDMLARYTQNLVFAQG